jgi:hypothetical protein
MQHAIGAANLLGSPRRRHDTTKMGMAGAIIASVR